MDELRSTQAAVSNHRLVDFLQAIYYVPSGTLYDHRIGFVYLNQGFTHTHASRPGMIGGEFCSVSQAGKRYGLLLVLLY